MNVGDTRGVRRRFVAFALLAVVIGILGSARPVSACSPPFNPTIEELGPAQVVVLGTTGERVVGGRLFHVERWYNGDAPVTPIVIAFKEGEPVGDCSYPVSAGTRLIIAPYMEEGRLSADLGTLQANPDSEAGRRYVEEAIRLFGHGVAPAPIPEAPSTIAPAPNVTGSVVDAAMGAPLILLAVGVLALGGAVFLVRRRRPR
jgi:hypothetical protein